MVSGNLDDSLGRSQRGSDARLHAPHGLRQSQPLQAGRVSAAIRFSHAEHQRGKALHHHRPAAAPVPDEQRLHAGRNRRQLAKRVAAEPDNRSRIRKVYLLAYGRDPSEAGNQAGHRLPARRAACGSTKRTRTNRRKPARWPRRTRRSRRRSRLDRTHCAAAKPDAEARGTVAERTRPPAATPADGRRSGMAPMGMGMMGGMGGCGGRRGRTRRRSPK